MRARAATGRSRSTCRSCRHRRRWPALDYLYYVGSASSFDPRGQKIARAFVKVAQAAGVKIGILGAGRGLHRRVRAAPRQRDGVPDARDDAHRDAERARREAHRHHRSARVQRAEERVRRVRRPLRGRASHAGDRRVDHVGTAEGEADARARDLPRAVLPRSPQQGIRRAAARSCTRCRRTVRSSSRWRATRRCAAAPAAAACGSRKRSARASTCCAPSRRWRRRRPTVATACPYCAVMVGDGLAQVNDKVPARDIAELVAEAL